MGETIVNKLTRWWTDKNCQHRLFVRNASWADQLVAPDLLCRHSLSKGRCQNVQKHGAVPLVCLIKNFELLVTESCLG